MQMKNGNKKPKKGSLQGPYLRVNRRHHPLPPGLKAHTFRRRVAECKDLYDS